MKLYYTPKIGRIRFEPQDVIRTSGGNGGGDGGIQTFGTGENFVFDDLS